MSFNALICSCFACSNNTSKTYCTRRNVIVLIVLIWVVMLCMNVPTLLAHRVKTVYGYTYCGIRAHAIGPMFVTFFAFAYALPLALVCVLYVLIMRFLQRANRTLAAHAHGRERTAHASRVIVLVVVVFGLSWLPHHVNALLSYYVGPPSGKAYEVVRVLCNCMAYGNSCANPIIYNYVSREFRKSFKEVICRLESRHASALPATTSEMVHMMVSTNGDDNKHGPPIELV